MNSRIDKTAKVKAPRPKKNLTLITIVLLVVVVVTAGLFLTLSSAFKTESYYVLNVDLPAKALVTANMLTPVETSSGTAPQNAIGIEQVQRGVVFTKYPLKAKDILTVSNTGAGVSISAGIPDTWVTGSFNISSNDAVGANVTRGEYFDIIGVNPDGARYLYLNVLALDVYTGASAGTSIATPAGTVTTQGGGMGIEMQYIIGMPPEDMATFFAAQQQYEVIKIVKSPYQIVYETRATTGLDRIFLLGNRVTMRDLFVGTDATFAEVRRDELSQPVNKANCAAGYIVPKELCADIASLPDVAPLRGAKPVTQDISEPVSIPTNSDSTSANSDSTSADSDVTTEADTPTAASSSSSSSASSNTTSAPNN